MARILLAVWLAGACVLAQRSGVPAPRARDALDAGVSEYRRGHYAEAAKHFEEAATLDPGAVEPSLYLAYSYLSRYVPGKGGVENLDFARQAERQFLKILANNPDDEQAIGAMAMLAFERTFGMTDAAEKAEQSDLARGWYERLAEVSPKNKDAHFKVAVLGLNRCHDIAADARAVLAAKCGAVWQESLAHLKKALEIDPEYEDAMAYMNLLLRDRAAAADSPEAAARDTAEAAEWVSRVFELKKRKAMQAQPPRD